MPTHRGLPADDPLRGLPQEELDKLLGDLIESWPKGRTSDHIRLEIAATFRRGHEARPLPPTEDLLFMMEGLDHASREKVLDCYMGPPLAPGQSVPGCGCPTCTGIPENHPARIRPKAQGHSEDWEREVEKARTRPLLDLARRLGMKPRKAGKDYVTSCPFHEDRTPSLSLSPEKGLWHCFSCGRGGDGIGLVMELRRLDFPGAVRELSP